jgi:heme oxygenase
MDYRRGRTNTGSRLVILDDAWLGLPKKDTNGNDRIYPGYTHALPALTEGRSHDLKYFSEWMGEHLRDRGFSGTLKLTAIFTDSVGACYRSKKLAFPIDKWADRARESAKEQSVKKESGDTGPAK